MFLFCDKIIFVIFVLIHYGYSFNQPTFTYNAMAPGLCPTLNTISSSESAGATGCNIITKTLDNFFPLIVNTPNYNTFLKPDKLGGIRVAFRDVIRLACPGEGNIITGTPEKHQYQNFVCLSDGSLADCLNKNNVYKVQDFRCQSIPSSIVRKVGSTTGDSLRPNEEKLEIGFQTAADDKSFLPIIQIYQDTGSLSTYYVKSEVWPTLKQKPKFSFSRESFTPEFYHQDLNLAEIYDGKKQLAHINQLLGYTTSWISESLYKTNIKRLDSIFLNRGHLAPKGSFLYYPAAKATFRYVNTQPQWQTINNEMWSNIEGFSADLAEEFQRDLTVYTGTHGQFGLKTKSGNQVPIFLAPGNKISVPMYFWKMMVDEETKRGIVFVTVNSPLCNVEGVESLCKTKSPVPEGVKPDNMKRPVNWGSKRGKWECGFSYWCEVDDFLQTSGVKVHGLKLPLSGLLYALKP